MATGPLTGVAILDLARLAPGPYCTMILGDLGADIVKVEEPGPPTGRRAQQAGAAGARMPASGGFGSSPFNALNRNQRSICLNLKSEPGRVRRRPLRGRDRFTAGLGSLLGPGTAQPEPSPVRWCGAGPVRAAHRDLRAARRAGASLLFALSPCD